MAYELPGKDFIPADVEPKVTGRAKYAEDFTAEPEGCLPIGEDVFEEWPYGDLDAGFRDAAPVVADMIVNAASGREQSHGPLQVSTA